MNTYRGTINSARVCCEVEIPAELTPRLTPRPEINLVLYAGRPAVPVRPVGGAS